MCICKILIGVRFSGNFFTLLPKLLPTQDRRCHGNIASLHPRHFLRYKRKTRWFPESKRSHLSSWIIDFWEKDGGSKFIFESISPTMFFYLGCGNIPFVAKYQANASITLLEHFKFYHFFMILGCDVGGVPRNREATIPSGFSMAHLAISGYRIVPSQRGNKCGELGALSWTIATSCRSDHGNLAVNGHFKVKVNFKWAVRGGSLL